LQTHRYKEAYQAPSSFVSRVIVETLKHTKDDELLDISQIADRAKTTTEQVALILGRMLQLEVPSGAQLTNSARFKLAVEAVRHGALQQVARALSWQEFEAFTEECLQTVGFDTRKGIIVKDDSRRWQIDVIAKKSRMILAIDCKHWESPGYDSKLTKAADHQRLALHALIQQMTASLCLADHSHPFRTSVAPSRRSRCGLGRAVCRFSGGSISLLIGTAVHTCTRRRKKLYQLIDARVGVG